MPTNNSPFMQLNVEPDGERLSGPCECCGNDTRCVWGFISADDEAVAAYYVSWTLGMVADHGAVFDLVIGQWGDDSTPADRRLVTLRYRLVDESPAFMVADASGRPADSPDLVGQALARSEVVGTPIAQQAFDLVDAIWDQDDRLKELSDGV